MTSDTLCFLETYPVSGDLFLVKPATPPEQGPFFHGSMLRPLREERTF